MKRILLIVLVLWSAQVSAQPWFWGNATYQFKKSGLYFNWLDSAGTTMFKYSPNAGGLIYSNNTTLPSGLNTTGSNRTLQIFREGSTNAMQFGSWGIGASNGLNFWAAGGTMASPTATQATNQFFFMTSNGHDGTGYGNAVGFLATAAINWTNTTGGHLVNWDIRHPTPFSNLQKASIAYVGFTNGLYLMPGSGPGGRVSAGGSTLLIPHAQMDIHAQYPTDTVLCVNGASGQTAALQVWSVNSAVIDSVKPDGTFVMKQASVYNASTSSRTDSFATLDATTRQIVMAALPSGGSFYDSVKMATQYRLDTVKANIRTQITAISGGGYDSSIMASKYYVDTVKSNLRTSIAAKLTPNAPITSATKTKITYDANGLVTAGSSLAAADIPKVDSAKFADSAGYTVTAGNTINLNGQLASYYLNRANHTGTQAWSTITSTPTTLSGYGITDAAPLSHTHGMSDLTGFNISTPSNGDLLKYDNATSKWINFTPSYITGNQSITLSGDVSGVGTTAITTTIGAGKVTNAMLAGSIAASKFVGTDIATVGTITSGTWNGTIISPTYGGTGVNNGTKTITLGGNLTTSGAFNTTLTATATTSVTLPTSGTLATLAGSETLTNKTLTTPVIASITNTGTMTLPTVTGTLVQYAESATTSSATPAPTGDARQNYYDLTALATAPTFASPSGTPANHNLLTIRIKDNGTARALTWNAIYRAGTTVALPTTTTISKTMHVQFEYNSADSKWDLVGVVDGF